jgi:hypothetical protein
MLLLARISALTASSGINPSVVLTPIHVQLFANACIGGQRELFRGSGLLLTNYIIFFTQDAICAHASLSFDLALQLPIIHEAISS